MRIIPIMIDTPMQIIYDITDVSSIGENKNKHEGGGGFPQKGKGGSQVWMLNRVPMVNRPNHSIYQDIQVRVSKI